MKKTLAVPALLALAAACARGPEVAQRIPSDSSAYFRQQVQELQAVAAAKDSLVRDLAETTKLIADINTEIAKVSSAARRPVEPVVGAEGMTTNERQMVLKRVQDLTTRLQANQQRLAANQRRLRELTTQADELQATITNLQATLEQQKSSIATLEAELTGTREQVATLTTEKTVLTDTVSALTTRENSVYYVIGTKKDLKDRGIVREQGGTRFLIFTRTGEVIRPVDNLDPSLFTSADRRTLTTITMPDPNKEYEVVSDQNLSASNVPAEAKRRFRGTLEITDPVRFWATSKFLVIVEK
ncbi:MAG: hypothetical protein ACT4PM_15400 [Gemmatimonadales bacterium]